MVAEPPTTTVVGEAVSLAGGAGVGQGFVEGGGVGFEVGVAVEAGVGVWGGVEQWVGVAPGVRLGDVAGV